MPYGRPIHLPKRGFRNRPVPLTKLPTSQWVRLHLSAYDPVFFSLNPTHRFSHPESPRKILYAAADEETALTEVFGDHVFLQSCIANARWEGSAFSRIEVPEIEVCDLANPEIRTALQVDLAALFQPDLKIPQAWGLAIQTHPAGPAGIRYQSRFSGVRCLALFEGVPVTKLDPEPKPVAESHEAKRWLEEREVALV